MFKANNIEGLHKLKRDIADVGVSKILDLVESHLDEVKEFMKRENPKGPESMDGMCLMLSRVCNSILKEHGLNPTVLQGEVETDADSWLEHHISFVRLESHWVLIDFSARQIDRYKEAPFLVLVCKPDKDSLKEILKKTYDWWTRD